MECPFCGSESTKVIDSRMCGGERIRKRVCGSCKRTHTTAERISAEWMKVRKRDGTVEGFVRAKITNSILAAAGSVPIAPAEVTTYVDRVIRVLQPDAPDIPVSSREIGRLVMEQLRGDPAVDVLRIRYALVFYGSRDYPAGFKDAADFVRWLDEDYGPPRVAPAAGHPTLVIKRDGRGEPFHLGKLRDAVRRAAAGRGTGAHLDRLAHRVADEVIRRLTGQAVVTSQQIGAETIHVLRGVDAIAYLRYAAVVKGYRSADDVWLDAMGLLSDP